MAENRLFPLGEARFEPKTAVKVSDAAQLLVAMAAHERLALVESERGGLAIVDLYREEVAARGVGHESEITAVVFAPGGLLLSTAADNTLRVWRREGDRLTEQFQVRLNRSVRHMKLLPDGATLLMLLARERGVRRLRLDELLAQLRDLGLGGDLPDLRAGPLPPASPHTPTMLPEIEAGKGFRTELFYRPGLSGPMAVRLDPAIDHDWTARLPDPGSAGTGIPSAGPASCRHRSQGATR